MISVRSEVQILPGPPEDRRQMPDARPYLTSVVWHLTSGPGAVAQLGERLLCKQEVDGSIPFSSTRKARCQRTEDRCQSCVLTSGICPLTSDLRCLSLWRGSEAIGFAGRALLVTSSKSARRRRASKDARDGSCLMGGLIAWNVKCETRAEKNCGSRFVEAGFGFARIKRLRAFGGCLGTERR